MKSATLQVISLIHCTVVYTRGWAVDSPNTRMRIRAELERADQEIAVLRKEIRIKDVRMGQLSIVQAPTRRARANSLRSRARASTHSVGCLRRTEFIPFAVKGNE